MPLTTKIIDLGEATLLLTQGFRIYGLEQSENGLFKLFIFETAHPVYNDLEISESILKYQRRAMQIDAYSFYRAGKELKTRIHEHDLSLGIVRENRRSR